MILKQIPEDFIVDEIPLFEPSGKGRFAICSLSKKNFNTEDALIIVSKKLNVQRKNIGFAGTKDKVAITTQRISVVASKNKIDSFLHDSISLNFLGYHDEPLSLGRLYGNKFKITIRGLLGSEKINHNKKIINFFHNQRFQDNNVVIGKLLLKKNYRGAVDILRDDFSFGKNIVAHLEKSNNDFVGALKTIPKKILTLYLHAYQSDLWNRAVKELLLADKLPKEVPIPGFSDFVVDDATRMVLDKIMLDEGVSSSDFLNRDIPYLCIEGTSRNTVIDLSDLVIGDFSDDDLNSGKKKIVLSFSLSKGVYATNVVEQLFA
jgi:tRNA pseudouridine13 synthase